MAKLQAQLSTMNNAPSFNGIQAPTPRANIADALNALKQQQFMAQNGQPGAQGMNGWGALFNRGAQGTSQAGQQVGNMIGNALGAAPIQQASQSQQAPQGAAPQAPSADPSQGGAPSGPPAPPGTPQYQQWMSQKVLQGRQITNSLIAAGKDPISANMTGLNFLASQGIPGAAEELTKLQQTQTAEQQKAAGADKDRAQAANFQNESANRDQTQALNTKKDTWAPVPGSENQWGIQMQNQLGERKFVEKQPGLAGLAQSFDPQTTQFAADTYRTTGKMPTYIRSPAQVGAVLKQVAADADASGDSAGAIAARQASLHANQAALSQTTKQEAATTSYFDTMDKNIEAARKLANSLDFSNPTAFNAALQSYLRGTSDPQYAKYNVFFDSIGNEYAKIKSGSLGNATVSDAARKEAMSVLAPTLGNGGAQAAFDAIRAEGNNRLASLRAERQRLQGELGVNAPGVKVTNAPANSPVPPAQGGTVVDFSSLK
jgi:hypothetical protein